MSRYAENVEWVVRNFGGKLFRDYDSQEELRALLIFSVMRTIDRARTHCDYRIDMLPALLDPYNDMQPSEQCVNAVRSARFAGFSESYIYEILGGETARLLGTLVSASLV